MKIGSLRCRPRRSKQCEEGRVLAVNVSYFFHCDTVSHTEIKGRRRKIKCTWTSDAARVCQECSEHDRPCASQGAVNNASIGKRSNLKIRIGKLESIIERLSKSHPEKALEAISETDSSSSPSSRTTGPAQNNNIPGQEQLKGLKSPLLDLFDNEVVSIIRHFISTIAECFSSNGRIPTQPRRKLQRS